MTMTSTASPGVIRQLIRVLGLIAGWLWAIAAGIGGLGLIITIGTVAPTNGWFALFSVFSAWPATAWLLRKVAAIKFRGWAQFIVALLFIVAGRLTLKIEGRGSFLPDFH